MGRLRMLRVGAAFLVFAGLLAADDSFNCTGLQGDFSVSLNDSNPFDPRISIGDGCCSSPVGDSFQLQANDQGGGIFILRNFSGDTFSNLNFFADFGQEINFEDFHCDPGPFFGGCGVNVSGNTVNILFFGGSGIPSAPVEFLIDPPITPEFGGSGGWLGPNGAPLILTVNANVPEPSTFVLLLGAAGVLVARRKLFASRS